MNRIRRAGLTALLMGCIGCILLAPAAQATGRAECVSLPSKILERAVPYCVLLPPSYDAEKTRRYPILYLLHGLGDNEEFLVHSGGMNLVEDLWEQHQLGEMLIVTPAGGVSFYINSHDGKRRYEDFFLREFMPGVEKRYRALAGRGSRGIGGISMGGYGALHIAFQHPAAFCGGRSAQRGLDGETTEHHRGKFASNEPVARSRAGIWFARPEAWARLVETFDAARLKKTTFDGDFP